MSPMPATILLSELADQSLACLDWPLVLEQIARHAYTPYGDAMWREQPFLQNIEAARAHSEHISQLARHVGCHGLPPEVPNRCPDSRHSLTQLTKGGLLSWTELTGLRNSLVAVQRWWDWLARRDGLAVDCPPYPRLLADRLNQTVSEDGEVLSSASTALGQLLHRQKSLQQAAEHTVQQLLTNPDLLACLQSPQISIRDGQLVLPVRAVHKHHFPGQLLGGSSSGATVFMTPTALNTMNRRLHETHQAIEDAMNDVLVNLCEAINEQLPIVLAALAHFAQLDRWLAGVLWAKSQQAEAVELIDKNQPLHMALRQLRHPLIENAVGNDVQLGLPDRTLVITGPNTGGKTVLLKTLGLAVLLTRCGLPLPTAINSRISWFDTVYADVGDEQSITQSLSTFSAHLAKLNALVKPATDLSRSLVLLDEIAAGTDPTEGAALAQAVLTQLHDAGALTVVTTHLGQLKLFTHEQPGFQNASVSFDPDTLAPTYRLIQGIPGSSHALSIAERLGLNPRVVAQARELMSAGEQDIASLLEDLARQQVRIQEELHRAASYRAESQAIHEQLERERQQLEQDRKQLLHQLKTNLRSQTQELQTQIKRIRKRLYKEIDAEEAMAGIPPSTGASRYRVGRLASQLQSVDNQARRLFQKADKSVAIPATVAKQALAPGQEVYSRQLNVNVNIISIQGKRAQVQRGLIKATLPISDLEPRQTIRQQRESAGQQLVRLQQEEAIMQPILSDSEGLSSLICDVRGQSVEDALAQLGQFLDQALLAGYQQVSVIHGLGTGALKEAVRQYLTQAGFVKRFNPAQAVDGGDGKTLIWL